VIDLKNQIITSMDKYGLLEHPSHNRIKSTTEFYILCQQYGVFNVLDADRYKQAVRSLMVKKGLLVRYPESPIKDDVEQHDNYCSVACGDKETSADIFFYGLRHWFRYDHRDKTNGFMDWFKCFRQPYQITWFALCGGIKTTLLSFVMIIGLIGLIQLWGAIIIEGLKPKNNVSGKLLIWQLSQAKFILKPLVMIPLWIFNKRLKKYYGDSPEAGLFATYYCVPDESLLRDFASLKQEE
jgi:hypothetical protein